MSVQFVIGNSGSGKTETMFGRMVQEAESHPKKNYLVIVPEQFTLQTQRKLVELSSRGVIMNVDVLSFKRLAYRVFDDLGISELQVLEEIGKNLVLRRIAQEQEEKLPVLGAGIGRMGMVGEIKSLISEFMQYGISCDALREYLEKNTQPSMVLPPMLVSKLREVELLYRSFVEFLRTVSVEDGSGARAQLVTAEELLTVLMRHVHESELLRDAVIAFDEFTGFTPVQNQLLARMMEQAERMIFAVTMDAAEDFYHSRGSHELFDLPKETIRMLMRLAEEKHIEILDPVVLGRSDERRFRNSPNLFFLEQNLFRPFYRCSPKEPEEIRLTCYRNPREELIYTAREIRRLVEEGVCRYREIGVVTGAVSDYSGYVPEIFAKYEIPYFLDQVQELLFHPFIEFLRAIVEVIRVDFTYDAVMRCLRCGFFPVTEERLDRIDHYLRATGIRGKSRWSRKWTRIPGGMTQEQVEALDEERKNIYYVFRPAVASFGRKGSTVRQKMEALYGMLVSLRTEQKLWERSKQLLERNDQVRASTYEQIYRIVMELLDKYVSILGEEKITVQEFSELLDAGLDSAQVASIPPGYDSVTFGDIERTRLNHIKVLFFIGVNDGVIPKAEDKGGLLSGYERELLREKKLSLAPGAREQTFTQRYYLYLNLTKPSDRLYISFNRVDSEGKSLRPSYLTGVLRRMFPKLSLREAGPWELVPDYTTLEAARDYLVYGERDEEWYALARYFLEGEKQNRIIIGQLLEAAGEGYVPERISRVVAEALYGRELSGSVTRLERFASCAYAHFLQYGLALRERQQAGFASVDMGTLYHEALERYSRKLEKSKEDWFTVDWDRQAELCREAMEESILDYPVLSGSPTGADSHKVERMKHIFTQTVWALTRQVRKGDFVPKFFEISFDVPELSGILRYELGEHRSLRLVGRMDRLDTCMDEKGCYVKVIDYKSGSVNFDLVKIYQGTQLQLIVYMNAAMEMAGKHTKVPVIPGGAFYYHIDAPVIEAEEELTEEQAKEALLSLLRPDGLVNREEAVYRRMDRDFTGKSQVIPVMLKKSGEISESFSHVASTEEFDLLRKFTDRRILEAGHKILDGTVEINPIEDGQVRSCTWCPYQAVCGFDTRLPGFGFRHLPKLSREEAMQQMKEEVAVAGEQ